MIFSILSIFLILYAIQNFNRSFLLYMLLEVVWYPQAKLFDISGLPAIPISLIMSFFYVVYYVIKKSKNKFSFFPLSIPLIMLALSRFASCFSSLAGFEDEFSRFIGYGFTSCLEVWLIWIIVNSEKDFDFLLKGLTFIFLFAGVYGLIVYATHTNVIFDYKSSLVENGIDAYNAGDIRGYRLTSIFEHPLGAGMNFAIFIITILVAKLKFGFREVSSIIIYVTVVLAVICIFYTKMRAGLFMLIFGIPAFWKFKGKQFITLFVGFVVLLFIVFPLISDQIDVFQSLFNKKAQEDVGGSNLEMRLEQLGACVFFLQQSPITGFGEQCLLYLNGIEAYQLRALESVVFEEMVRHGILGLLATFVLMFFTTIHLPLKYHSKELFFVSLSFWVTYILTSIPFFRMHLFYIAYFYIIFQINKRKNIKRNK